MVTQQYATDIIILELGPMSYESFFAADVPSLLKQAMRQLTEFKLVLKPPSKGSNTVLPPVHLMAERLPALRILHIEGATLVCESLSRIKHLKLRNTTSAPLGHTCAEFLTMLSTVGKALEYLFLENYMGHMGAGDSSSFEFPLMCKTAWVKDSARNLYRLLAHLSEIPEDMRMMVDRSAPADLNLLPLKGLTRPRQKGGVHCATFKFATNGVKLVCAGFKHMISIEDYDTYLPVSDIPSVHNVVLKVLLPFLHFMPVSTLEINDPSNYVDDQQWFDLFALAPNVSELIVEQRVPSSSNLAVQNVFTALTSLCGQANTLRCPHLKDVKVRGATYSLTLVDTIVASAKWRAERCGPFRSLELVLVPKSLGQPRQEFASSAARGWAAKLKANGYVDRVTVTDAIASK